MTAERMSWWRAHHGLPSHPRWLQAARKSGQSVPVSFSVAMWLLDHASKATDRGVVVDFDIGPCAAFLWIEEDAVQAVVAALADIGWICAGSLSSWSERQPAKEDPSAAERKRQQREREKEAAAVSRDVTPSHASSQENEQRPEIVTPRVEQSSRVETDTEKKDTALNASARGGLGGLEQKLRSAAKLEESPAPSLADLSPILGLIDAGFDLETEILPTVRAKTHAKVRSWKFFVDACHDSRTARQAAATGAGHSSARAPPPDRRNKVFEALELNLAAMK